TGKKPFSNLAHDHHLITDIMNGVRPEITEDTPEFYAELMKRCWDSKPENRPTGKEIHECLRKYFILPYEKGVIESAELKRQEIVRSEKYLSDEKNYKYHIDAFYTSRALSTLIEKTSVGKVNSSLSSSIASEN